MGKLGKYLSAPRVIGVAWVMCLLPPWPILSRQSQTIKPKLGKRLWSEGGKRHSQKKKKRRVLVKCVAAAAKSCHSCPTLCDAIDGSPTGSSVPGVLQARILEWVAISFSNAGKWKVKVKSLSRVRLLATPWTVAFQAPLSMGFSRHEYWSGVPLPSPVKCVTPPKRCLCWLSPPTSRCWDRVIG